MKRRHYFLALLLTYPVVLPAQSDGAVGGRAEVFAGSDLERYLRYLQLAGLAARYPWTIGAFSPAEIDRIVPADSAHPWASRYDLRRSDRARTLSLIPPTVTLIENSTFPYGSNDGPIWAGRGLTGAAQMGLAVRYGALSFTAAPVAFSARNAAFALEPNGLTANQAFASGDHPQNVDRPQRFGSSPYSMIDPGQSTLRLDLPVLTMGISTANQRWGPGQRYPILVGDNAAGFPHVFVGSGTPWNLWLFRMHWRLMWGELFQSDYSTVSGVESKRFMSGLLGVITPRGLPTLELGGGRFFHTPWPAAGLRFRDFRKPLESILKYGVPNEVPGSINEDRDNQLASIFFRWTLPRSGVEVYGEYGREDHNWDMRAFMLQPDLYAGYMLGFSKVWRPDASRLIAVRAEMVDLALSSIVRGEPGGEAPFYTHGQTRQGHTYRGQLLGADVEGGAAAGSTVGVDFYHRRGRWTFEWTRTVRQDRGDYWRTGLLDPKALDVLHTLAVEALAFRGRCDFTARVGAVYEFNRNFQSDAFDINLVFRVRVSLDDSKPGAQGTRIRAHPSDRKSSDR